MEAIKVCKICSAGKIDTTPIFTEEQKNKLLLDIYRGIVTVENLPIDIYYQLITALYGSFNKGYGIELNKAENPTDIKTIKDSQKNLSHFAAAKIFTLVKEGEANRVSNKKVVKAETFLKNTTSIVDMMLGAFLFTEKDTTQHVAISKKQWNKKVANKELYLEYVTMRDGAVREAHAHLDGMIWLSTSSDMCKLNPPNGYNCRCKQKSFKKGVETDLTSFDTEDLFYNIPKEFRYNFGNSPFVWSPEHPYFNVPKKYKHLASKNFNLPYPHEN